MINVFETQTGYRVCRIRTDRGSEYICGEILAFYAEKGIKPEFAPTYTPTSNSRAERLNRTYLDLTRACLIAAGLPMFLWGEVIKTVNFMRNNLPVSDLDITPCEMLTGFVPDLSHLQPFGCLGVARIAKPRLKMEDKGEAGYLVGYEGNAYRLWFPESNVVEVRRDVKFYPTRFYSSTTKIHVQPGALEPIAEDSGKEEDIACEGCGSTSATRPSRMVLCDVCNRGYHSAVP